MAHAASSSPPARAFALLGGVVFVASLLYFLLSYLRSFGQPAPPGAPAAMAVLIDVALFTVFALHHSIFARTGARNWVTRHAPPALERSIYVWIASVLFVVVCGAWQLVPGEVWRMQGGVAAALVTLQLAGAVAAVVFARQLSVLELAGIRQVWPSSVDPPPATIQDHGGYGIVRHPIYLAWLVIVWATPVMTGTRLVFAAVSTAYLVVAIPIEERGLVHAFGAEYDAYRRKVRWRMIPGVY
jgi:protein-S-isoprenylcysteine O-methyltransferase Ste14